MYTETGSESVYSKYTGIKNNCQEAETLQCSECPLARYIEGDRYACGAYHNSDQVVRGHWKATNTCYVVLAKLQEYSKQQQVTQGTTVQQSETNPSASISGFCEHHNLSFERANVTEHYLIQQDSFLGIVGWMTQSKWYALSSEGDLIFEHSETPEKALKALLAYQLGEIALEPQEHSDQAEYHLNRLCEQENLKIRKPEGINIGWDVLKENAHVGMIGQDVKETYWAVDKAGFSRAEMEASKYLALRKLVEYLHFQEKALTK
ncbi:MAG: hypothetical protein BRC41_19245 [Cyanobacteria bacterium QH_9_48_43]|nr:MAG: hypothetical protein BRC41_19245 [Cyanobacteria bacterium QH_9_48_43]